MFRNKLDPACDRPLVARKTKKSLQIMNFSHAQGAAAAFFRGQAKAAHNRVSVEGDGRGGECHGLTKQKNMKAETERGKEVEKRA
jgi:hypothetical protein